MWIDRHLPGVGRTRVPVDPPPRLSPWALRQMAAFDTTWAGRASHFVALDPGLHLTAIAFGAPPPPPAAVEQAGGDDEAPAPPVRPSRPRADPRHEFVRRRSSQMVRAILAGPPGDDSQSAGGQRPPERRPSRCFPAPPRPAAGQLRRASKRVDGRVVPELRMPIGSTDCCGAVRRCAPSSGGSPFLTVLRQTVRLGRLPAAGAGAPSVVKRAGLVTSVEYQLQGYCPE